MSKRKKITWKDALLKSSLPLEFLVSEKLSKIDFLTRNDYSFFRKDENGIEKEFSTDVYALNLLKKKDLDWAKLEFLIECKYSHESVNWVFIPETINNEIIGGSISTIQELSCYRFDTDEIFNFDSELEYCTKGVELHSTGSNPQAIKRAINQLSYSIAHLAARNIKSLSYSQSSLDPISIISPILVTTADLFVLNREVSLESIKHSNDLEEVTEKVPYLIMENLGSQDLNRYCAKIAASSFVQNRKEMEYKIDQLSKCIDPDSIFNLTMYPYYLDEKPRRASERILIVNYDHFEDVIKEIINSINKAGKTLFQIADFKRDEVTNATKVIPFTKKT
ncbi:MAG: hypothetical protein ABJK11_13415 [Balneola sp.]